MNVVLVPADKVVNNVVLVWRLYYIILILLKTYVYSCPLEIMKGLTDKEQFQYLTKLKGPKLETFLCTTQFLSLR